MPSLITPRELTKWVPGKVLSASDALGWKDVAMWDRTLQFRGSITSRSSAIVSVRADGAALRRTVDPDTLRAR